MSRRSSAWPQGMPCWIDLATTDLERVKGVYAEAFGWELVDSGPDYGGYINALKDGSQAAGMATAMEHRPSAWLVYLASADADATAKAITHNGGAVVWGPMVVPGICRILTATDPNGAPFGVYEAGPFIGAEIVNEPGSLTWEHLDATDEATAMAFYGNVFGWVFQSMGEGAGHTFAAAAGEPPMGSLGTVTAGDPGGWLPFIATEDADRIVSVFTAAGATIVSPAMDTPWGRMATIADPSGAVFSVMTPSPDQPVPDREG